MILTISLSKYEKSVQVYSHYTLGFGKLACRKDVQYLEIERIHKDPSIRSSNLRQKAENASDNLFCLLIFFIWFICN